MRCTLSSFNYVKNYEYCMTLIRSVVTCCQLQQFVVDMDFCKLELQRELEYQTWSGIYVNMAKERITKTEGHVSRSFQHHPVWRHMLISRGQNDYPRTLNRINKFLYQFWNLRLLLFPSFHEIIPPLLFFPITYRFFVTSNVHRSTWNIFIHILIGLNPEFPHCDIVISNRSAKRHDIRICYRLCANSVILTYDMTVCCRIIFHVSCLCRPLHDKRIYTIFIWGG